MYNILLNSDSYAYTLLGTNQETIDKYRKQISDEIECIGNLYEQD